MVSPTLKLISFSKILIVWFFLLTKCISILLFSLLKKALCEKLFSSNIGPHILFIPFKIFLLNLAVKPVESLYAFSINLVFFWRSTPTTRKLSFSRTLENFFNKFLASSGM